MEAWHHHIHDTCVGQLTQTVGNAGSDLLVLGVSSSTLPHSTSDTFACMFRTQPDQSQLLLQQMCIARLSGMKTEKFCAGGAHPASRLCSWWCMSALPSGAEARDEWMAVEGVACVAG